MKSLYVRDLPLNQPVTATFLVHAKEVRQKKSGDPYLSLVLGDRTGEVDAKMWENVAEVMDTFGADDFVRVKGQLGVYQNRPQFTIHKLQRLSDSDVELEDFFPTSSRDPMEMFVELEGIIAGVANPDLRALLRAVFGDEQIAALFRKAPAAKSVHHAWLGGLLEHTISLCALCRMVATNYPGLNPDLLIAGALLHDLGKIYELDYNRSVSYTTEGQLLGHIVLGLRIIDEKLRKLPDFPPKLRILLEHMILSHHGRLEFGSPKEPMFPEALLLHFLDDLDAKMGCMQSLINRDNLVEGEWTSFSAPLERSVLKMDRYLEDSEPVPEPDPAPAPARSSPPKRTTVFGEKLLSALSHAKAPPEE